MPEQALRTAAAELLKGEGIDLRVVKLNRVAPLDAEAICAALAGASHIVVAEDQLRTGCAGERLAAVLAERGIQAKLLLRNAGSVLPSQGTVSELWQALGLDVQGIAQAVREVLHE